jgi:hypothetical protein
MEAAYVMHANRSPTHGTNRIYTDPENKEVWEGLGKDGRAKSMLCFRTGNTLPKPCEEEEKKKQRKLEMYRHKNFQT